MANYGRLQQSQTAITNGTFTASSTTFAHVIYNQSGTKLLPGTFVHITSSTITNVTNGNYYWVYYDSSDTTQIVLSTAYLTSVSPSYGLTGTATFETVDMATPIQNQPATEPYFDSTGTQQYRYYVGDIKGRVWVYDTGIGFNSFWYPGGTMLWALASNSSDASVLPMRPRLVWWCLTVYFFFSPTVQYQTSHHQIYFTNRLRGWMWHGHLPHSNLIVIFLRISP